MATLGAAEVIGCDISESGLLTARERAKNVPNIRFMKGSVLELPFENNSFDFVCCAGVLHHTTSIAQGLDELTRILKPGGKLFLLLYGAGGLRWKLITALRPLAAELGIECVDAGIKGAELPANNRKHFLDDLFVPVQSFVKWNDLRQWLEQRGFVDIERWTAGRYDHEANPSAQIEDMEKLRRIFADVAQSKKGGGVSGEILAAIGANVAEDFVTQARKLIENSRNTDEIEKIVIGEGNHRVLATRRQTHV